jgi:PAS domain S-box-containing protein
MPGTDLVSLGIAFVVVAIVLLGLTLLLLRLVPRSRSFQTQPATPSIKLDLNPVNHAVLLVQSGGRVTYANELAREWFGHHDDEPNLERLARRTRPSEVFLSLCASEGQTRFSLDGRLVEGSSYYIPPANGTPGAFLVSLQRPQVTTGETQVSGQALDIFAELSQTMASSLELEKALQVILESVERLVPCDFSEIAIWDADNQQAIPYHFVGLANVDRRLERASQRYEPGKGYSGYLISNRKPLLIENIDTYREVRPAVDRKQYPFNSYLGMPLLVAGELVGTLELASLAKNGFTDADLEMLRMLAGQAAVTLNNALLFQEEQRRVSELSGLANLAQASGTLRDSQDFYARLVESIAPMFSVKTLGFLIFDESHRKLQAQLPFIGLPPDFVVIYEVVIPPGGLAEDIWLSQDMLMASQAAQDVRLEALGLAHFAVAAGIQNTILVPLTSTGRMFGYLQVADREDGLPFGEDDIRLLTIVAGQAATIIENAILVKQSQERATRSEAMRRIASLTGSMATLDEILSFSLRELARLLKADIATIFMVDENRAELAIHKESLYGIHVEKIGRLGRISMNDPNYYQTVTANQEAYFSEDAPADTDIAVIYQPLIATINVKSVVIVPLVIRERGVGEIMLASRDERFFERSDLGLITTAANQLSGSIEKSFLYSQTDDSLRRRIEQLLALMRVSRELNTRLDLKPLLELVYDELIHTTQASCGNIWLFEWSDQPEGAPAIMLAVGDELEQRLIAVEEQVVAQLEPLIVANYAEPIPELANAIIDPPHEGIQSSLIVPIIYQEAIAGLIHMHARQSGIFDKTSLDIALSLSTQAAIALGNSMRFHEQIQRTELLNRRVETLSMLLEANKELSPDQPLEQSMEAIAYAIQDATPFNVVLISIYAASEQLLERVASAGIPLETMKELREKQQSWSSVMQLCTEEFRYSQSYMIPYERRRVDPVELHLDVVQTMPTKVSEMPVTDQSWNVQDMLLVPLFDSARHPLGLISVDAPRNGLRPDKATIESLEVFASQAALTIESHQKIKEMSQQVKAVSLDYERARNALAESQTHLPFLLHKDVEQMIAIDSLEQRARRIQAGLEIAELVNRQPTRIDVLQVFGKELLTRLDMNLVLISESSPGGVRLVQLLGVPPSSAVNVEALLGQKNPVRNALSSGEIMLVSQVDEEPDWKGTPLLNAMEAKAFACLPIVVNGVVDSVLLAVHHAPLPPMMSEDRHLFEIICRQVAIALENLRLLNETNRRLQEVNLLLEFSRQLGSLDTVSVLRTLVESSLQVVPAAQAGMVALWDAEQECLVPQTASGYLNNSRIMEITYRSGQALPGIAFERGEALRLDEVNFARDYNLSSEHLLLYRAATEGRLPISSLIMPIQTGEHNLGVLVLDNFKTSGAFQEEDQALIASLVRQTALTLENIRLYQAAEQRAAQMLALTKVSATITSSLQSDDLIGSLLDQVEAVIPYDTAILWLRQGSHLTVRAVAGFEDSDQRIGLSVAEEDSALLGEMIATSHPISVPDVREDSRFTSLVEYERLSWLGVPLLSKGEVVGVIALEKTEANYYTPDHIASVITFAGQAAVALVNARLYEESVSRAAELDQRSQRLALLNRLSTELSGSLDLDYVLRAAGQELSQAVHCSSVSSVLVDGQGKMVLRLETRPETGSYPLELPESPLYERLRESLGIFMTSDVFSEEILDSLQGFLYERNTHSLMIVPLATGTSLLGFFVVHVDHPYRFEAGEVELARTISNQTSVALQNARLFAETERLVAETEQAVTDRTRELAEEHNRTQTLLDIITELSASLDLDLVLNRTLSILNETTGAGHSLIMLLKIDEPVLYLRSSLGYADRPPKGGMSSSIKPDEGLAGWVIKHRQPVMIPDLLEDPRWVRREDKPSEHRSALAVPLVIGEENLGVLILYHKQTSYFATNQLELVQATARQIAVAINNAQLFNLIRDQAERLGDMLRTQHVETSRSQAMLEAVADGVLITDANRVITLFNASAERILGLSRTQVVGRSLENFIGLFGKAAQDWVHTIRTWSEDPSSYQSGESYAEQLDLDDRRVVSVHLSPVLLRNDFLGTVSIFRDITHLIEVDRLKSEFVATVSHELRTPMTSIKGYVEIMLMGAAGQLSDQQTHFLQVVRANTERLAVLVNDLLDISRIEAGKITLSMQPLDMHKIVKTATATITRRIQDEDRSMHFDAEIEPDLPTGYGDPERIQQIIDNLVANSYQYTPDNGHIWLRVFRAGEELQVDVKDNGIGIHPEDQPRIFQRFFRGEDPMVLATSGTGLGLAIVKHLVEMHHGRIWFESTGVPGHGSVFSFTLPIFQPQKDKVSFIL